MNYQNLFGAFCIFFLCVYLTFYKESHNTKVNNYDVTVPMVAINQSSPPCLQMYDAIIKYSEQYEIPKRFAFGIAFCETRYGGPFDWNYDHKKISCAGAIGPMQIMPSTARGHWKDTTFTNADLKDDIDFNVHTSMKVLRKLHDRYRDWKIVFGCYNTGRPLVNGYAERVYNFRINWKI
jgi:soluble lytic murein transglycosylase-like protein